MQAVCWHPSSLLGSTGVPWSRPGSWRNSGGGRNLFPLRLATGAQAVERDLTRIGKTIERLLTACQEDLISLDQLRKRMPLQRQREQTLRHELNALVEQTHDRAAHLRLAKTLSAFLTRLRASAETLDILEQQRIVDSSSRRFSSATTRS